MISKDNQWNVPAELLNRVEAFEQFISELGQSRREDDPLILAAKGKALLKRIFDCIADPQIIAHLDPQQAAVIRAGIDYMRPEWEAQLTALFEDAWLRAESKGFAITTNETN
jgi:hypothetical protein